MERTGGKTRSEMTARELREKGARLGQEAAKLPVGAVLPWIEASKEVERVYDLAKQREELNPADAARLKMSQL